MIVTIAVLVSQAQYPTSHYAVGNQSIEVVYNAVFGDLGAAAVDDTDGAMQ